MSSPSPREVFPFGRPVVACKPSAADRRPLFVLGAYPSALHVAWTPPTPFRSIQALAVDNEPEPFWTGADQESRVDAWKRLVGFDPERWGSVSVAGRFNGSSGVWIDNNVLKPLGFERAQAWITDSLDTYRCSDGVRDRLADTYAPVAKEVGLPPAVLAAHPSEDDIIREAVQRHQSRLRDELSRASPDMIVTLGNAALAVVREILPRTGGADTQKLSSSPEGYGTPVKLKLGSRDVELLPLAHPGAPGLYQTAHTAWVASRMARRGV
jgi:hypothetical protein